MRLLLLTYEFPPLGGGVGNSAASMIRALERERDLEMVVVTSSVGADRSCHGGFARNATVHYLDVGKDPRRPHYQSSRELVRYLVRCHQYLGPLLQEQTFDCCHAFLTLPAGLDAWAFRRHFPYVVSMQGSDVPGFSDRFRPLYPFLRPVLRRVWRDAGRVVANSSGLRELALASKPGRPIDVVPNGVDTELFTPPETPLDRDALRIVCVARLIERKGILELARAFETVVARLPEARLDFVGTGPLDGALRRWIAERALERKVTLHGVLEHRELSELLRRCALFALPSRWEGMSHALQEALASGLPVVVTDTGGTRELVRDNGVVVPHRDPRALATAIVELLEDEKLLDGMAAASRRIALDFSWPSMARRYMEIYRELASPSRAS